MNLMSKIFYCVPIKSGKSENLENPEILQLSVKNLRNFMPFLEQNIPSAATTKTPTPPGFSISMHSVQKNGTESISSLPFVILVLYGGLQKTAPNLSRWFCV